MRTAYDGLFFGAILRIRADSFARLSHAIRRAVHCRALILLTTRMEFRCFHHGHKDNPDEYSRNSGRRYHFGKYNRPNGNLNSSCT